MTEVLDDRVPALVHEDWRRRMPWLLQGTSTRGRGAAPFDLGYFASASPAARVSEHWDQLLLAAGMERAVLGRQVHEADVLWQRELPVGVRLTDVCDGHVTRDPGLLMAVTVADCVPVFLVGPESRVVAVLHAGWRGAAAGVLERGLEVLAEDLDVAAADLLVHMGPSICGACYEVGPEVFEALDQPVPSRPVPIDLRRVLARRAADAGVPWHAITVSTHCTRCTGSTLFSHRGGDGERQLGFIGIREQTEDTSG